MSALSVPARSHDDLLADLTRLSQGRGLTYGERTRLGHPPDLDFIDARLLALHWQRRWQPAALAGLLVFAVVLLLIAGGATAAPATWWPARPV